MKNKGFTLIELLAVIALLAIIIGFAVPNIISAITNEQGRIDATTESTVKAAVNLYIQNNRSKYSDNAIHYIKFKTLVDNDLLDSTILADYANYCVKATYSSNQYNYDIVTSCVEG